MFVRTKDGIYKIALTDKIRFGQYYCYKVDRQNINQYSIIAETSILNQADTIEELCDCFIGEFVNGEKVILEKWNGNKFVIRWATNMVYMIKDLNKTYANIKGAIWTDKGLIYVAKMNEKGELELCQN